MEKIAFICNLLLLLCFMDVIHTAAPDANSVDMKIINSLLHQLTNHSGNSEWVLFSPYQHFRKDSNPVLDKQTDLIRKARNETNGRYRSRKQFTDNAVSSTLDGARLTNASVSDVMLNEGHIEVPTNLLIAILHTLSLKAYKYDTPRKNAEYQNKVLHPQNDVKMSNQKKFSTEIQVNHGLIEEIQRLLHTAKQKGQEISIKQGVKGIRLGTLDRTRPENQFNKIGQKDSDKKLHKRSDKVSSASRERSVIFSSAWKQHFAAPGIARNTDTGKSTEIGFDVGTEQSSANSLNEGTVTDIQPNVPNPYRTHAPVSVFAAPGFRNDKKDDMKTGTYKQDWGFQALSIPRKAAERQRKRVFSKKNFDWAQNVDVPYKKAKRLDRNFREGFHVVQTGIQRDSQLPDSDNATTAGGTIVSNIFHKPGFNDMNTVRDNQRYGKEFELFEIMENVKCHTDPATNRLSCKLEAQKSRCEENWDFPNPCQLQSESILRRRQRYSHPRDPSKYLSCMGSGKFYIVQCPKYEVFHVGCEHCIDERYLNAATCSKSENLDHRTNFMYSII